MGRLAGLSLGNSVWASSLVLAAFMGGIGLGNLLAARYGERARRPLRLYAVLEVIVGGFGLGVVLVLPPWARCTSPTGRRCPAGSATRGR